MSRRTYSLLPGVMVISVIPVGIVEAVPDAGGTIAILP